MTRVLCWLLLGLALLAAADSVAGLAHYRVLRAMVDQDTEALASFSPITGLLLAALGYFQLGHWIVFCATIVVFTIWVHRMQANTFALGIFGLRFTPAWAVGWYFVPVANLWMPCRAMSETWRANRNPTGWQFDSGTGFLIVWWLLWLSSIFYIRISFNSGSPEDVLATARNDAAFESLRSALGALSALVSLSLVTRLQQFQLRAASQFLAHVFE